MLKSKYSVAVLIIVCGFLYACFELYSFQTDQVGQFDGKRTAAESQYTTREGELKRLKNFAQNIESVKQELRELNLQLESALESMPRTFNLAGLLRKLNLLAQNSGVELSSFKPRTGASIPGEQAEHGFYSTIAIEFQLKGSFTQTLVFLDQVSRLKRIININTLDIHGATGQAAKGAATGVISTEASIETYRFSD